jgi:murein DD-endopeptidase MepM/ murein hydrolase activator NlpD
MKKAIGSVEALRTFRTQVESQLGTENSVVDEKVDIAGSSQVYTRKAKFSKAPGTFIVQWGLTGDGAVTSFLVQPAPKEAASKYLDYRTKTPLRLPFEGEWTVFWGGRSVEENYHAAAPDQRFAYDFVIVRDGTTHTGDGSASEQYFCFGQPILAPGGGTVALSVDGLADNKPGVMDPSHPTGNHVVLDHGNGEFSFFAHFKKGSVKVKKGDKVKAGDPIGLCGNSGNTSEPHLHYHLQTTAVFSEGEGLPAQFLDYVADGKKVERGEPRKGQKIRRQ